MVSLVTSPIAHTVRLPRTESRRILAEAWAKRISFEAAAKTLKEVAAGLLVEDHLEVAIARAKFGPDNADQILAGFREEHRAQARASDCMFRRVTGSYGCGKRR